MMRIGRGAVLIRIVVAFLLTPVVALLVSAPPASAQVAAEIVAAEQGVQPGARTTVALQLVHDPGWHTYWVSPGIGEATTIEWDLPNGWVAGDIDWPVPVKIYTQAGEVSGHGYDGVAYLPVDLIASSDARPGETVTLKAAVKWLMCEYETCIRGGADLSLDLPVVDEPAAPNAAVQAALAATPMPEAGEAFEIAATRSAELMTLIVAGDETFSDPHFFSFDELVWHDAVQEYQHGEGRLQATLPIDDYYESEVTTLSGVLAFTDAQGDYRGLLINAPLTSAANTGMAPLPGPPLWQVLLFAFVGGLILNLMPCVLPILSMKALSLASTAGLEAAAVRREGVAYTLGVVLSFVAIAAMLLFARSALGGVGWGFHLQNPVIVLSLALVMAGVGFNLSGLFEMGLGLSGVGQGLTRGHGAKTAFFTGVLAVVVAAPCTAPFMATALGAALVQPAPIALSTFAVLGLGLAFPYLLIAWFPAARRWLPAPGAWMATFRQALAFPMFGAAIWLLWVLGGQSGTDAVAVGLIAVLLLGIAAWAFGRQQRHDAARLRWRLTTLAAVALILALFAKLNQFEPSERSRTSAETLLDEVAYTPAALEATLAAGEPVFAYFTADWCVTCKVNERVAVKTEATAALFTERGITVMVGDWTNENPDITAILQRYERAGVPMYLFFPPGASVDEGRLLPQILTPGIIERAVLSRETAGI